MTLEERLQRRLRNWRDAARQHRQCMDELSDESGEYWMHKVEAEVFERVISEVIADLSARSTPSAPRLSRGVKGNRHNLTVRSGT